MEQQRVSSQDLMAETGGIRQCEKLERVLIEVQLLSIV
jgi:hypothetical protein